MYVYISVCIVVMSAYMYMIFKYQNIKRLYKCYSPVFLMKMKKEATAILGIKNTENEALNCEIAEANFQL